MALASGSIQDRLRSFLKPLPSAGSGLTEIILALNLAAVAAASVLPTAAQGKEASQPQVLKYSIAAGAMRDALMRFRK